MASKDFVQKKEAIRAEERKEIGELRKAIAIEYRKAVEEAKDKPFEVENLNKEHEILWKGHASAYSETLSYIDLLLRRLKP